MPFLIAFLISVVLTGILTKTGAAIGLVDSPGQDSLKIHSAPIPLLGGSAIVVATFVATLATRQWLPLAIAAGVIVAFTAGAIDDAVTVSPGVRLGLQTIAGLVLIAEALPWQHGLLGAFATVLLVIVCSNAVNLIDGQDGLAGGVCALACLGLAGIAATGDGEPAVPLGLAAAGALVGFLVWNRPPAKIFLGNSGAYAMGVLLAVLVKSVVDADGWQGLLAAGLCMTVLAFEFLFTAMRRLFARQSLLSGDRLHSYDLLSAKIGRPRCTVVFLLVGAGVAAIGLAMADKSLAVTIAASAITFGTAGLAGLMLWARRASLPLQPVDDA